RSPNQSSEPRLKSIERSGPDYSNPPIANAWREFESRGIPFERERPLPLEYKGLRLDCGYRTDFLVAGQVVVEVKAIEALAPIHEAQLLTYLRIGGWKVGLLINFNVLVLKEGIRRRVLDLIE